IIQLDHDFNERAIGRNPSQFIEGFNSFLLFETIAAKAQCLEQRLGKNTSESERNQAVNTYRSALSLADHIEKVFDTEEARLFALKKIVPVQQRAVSLLVQLYEQTQKETYLEEAFRRCEQSKAAVLFIGQKENESKANTGIPDSLLQRERNLKFTLSQLFVRIDRATEDAEISRLRTDIRDTKLALSRMADQLHDYPEYYRKKFGADTIDLRFLRRQVLDRKTALLSFFQTEETTYTFVLTRNELRFHRIPNDRVFQKQLTSLVTALRSAIPGEDYLAEPQAQYLYRRLIEPLAKYLADKTSLIIIPHNDLTQLSFDVLENEQQQYLLEQFDITYQYSASFLRPESKPLLVPNQMLAVAPFNVTGLGNGMGVLPASELEVSGLKGMKLTNQNATKTRFLQLARQASIIHLATHAIANNDRPDQSYIAFAPQPNAENKLYAHELQYGILDKVKLVFLSACETASGQLIRGEGVMSLSRALSYAGCPNLITSLWKAEDNATAYISRQFYTHLDEGNTVSRSLQLAKLDLLQNSQYAQFHAPPYWSHLVFVGSPPEHKSTGLLWLLAGISGVLVLIGWRFRQNSAQKKITVSIQ
ncbi:MAG: CHAT domain-containing protein, partial [Rudanella sp.]|nr:CHAT domain-containing protein [Rudanella sp.]